MKKKSIKIIAATIVAIGGILMMYGLFNYKVYPAVAGLILMYLGYFGYLGYGLIDSIINYDKKDDTPSLYYASWVNHHSCVEYTFVNAKNLKEAYLLAIAVMRFFYDDTYNENCILCIHKIWDRDIFDIDTLKTMYDMGNKEWVFDDYKFNQDYIIYERREGIQRRI